MVISGSVVVGKQIEQQAPYLNFLPLVF